MRRFDAVMDTTALMGALMYIDQGGLAAGREEGQGQERRREGRWFTSRCVCVCPMSVLFSRWLEVLAVTDESSVCATWSGDVPRPGESYRATVAR